MFGLPGSRAVVRAFSLYLMVAALPASGQETLRQDHNRFYRAGSILDINQVVGLDKVKEGLVVEVAIGYNMTRSKVEVDWICNDEVLRHSKLDQGMNQEVTFTFNRPLPASLQARFTGSEGQVQIRWVSVVTAPRDPASARIVQGVPAQEGDTKEIKPGIGGVGVVAATPVPAQIDEDSLLTPAELAPFVSRVEIEPEIIRPGTTATGRVVLGVKALAGGFVVPLQVHGGRASSVHVPEEVVVAEGQLEVEFDITADPTGEDEKIRGRLASEFTIVAEGGRRGATFPPQGSAQVLQPELASLRFDPRPEVPAGDTAHLTLTLAEPASPGGTVVWLRAVGPPEETAKIPGRLWIEEGELGATLPIATSADSRGDLQVEGQTAFQKLSDMIDITFGVKIDAVRLEPDNLRPGTTVDLVVELAEPAMAGGSVISLDVSKEGAARVEVAPEIVIAEGETTGGAEVTIAPQPGGQLAAAQMADQYARLVNIEASTTIVRRGHQISTTRSVSRLITQVDVYGVNFTEQVVRAGQTAVATITLDEPASPGGTLVWLFPSGSAAEFATVPEEVRFAEGEISREVEIPIDLAATDLMYLGLTLILEARSNDRSARGGTLLDYPTFVESVVVDPTVIPLGESFTVTVTMTEPVPWDDFWIAIRAAEKGWHPRTSPGPAALRGVGGGGPTPIPKGETTATAEMRVTTWCEDEGPINIWVTIQRFDYFSTSTPAEIVRLPEIERFGVTGEETVPPGSTVRYRLTLADAAPASGVPIRLSSNFSTVNATWPEEITIDHGQRDTTFEVSFAAGETGTFNLAAQVFSGGIGWSSARTSITVQE
jgi:hypothetical protein